MIINKMHITIITIYHNNDNSDNNNDTNHSSMIHVTTMTITLNHNLGVRGTGFSRTGFMDVYPKSTYE